MVARSRIFSSHDNVLVNYSRRSSSNHVRKPLAATATADLNSVNNVKEPRVKGLLSKQKWGFMKPRSVSSPELMDTRVKKVRGYEVPLGSEAAASRTTTTLQPHMLGLIPTMLSVAIPKEEPRVDERSVVLRMVPSNIGLSSILAQTCGGPLERVNTKYEIGATLRQNYLVELYFLKTEDAKNFYALASSGRFLVNGKVYTPSRAMMSTSEDSIRTKQIAQAMMIKHARRCVVLNKPAKLPKSRDAADDRDSVRHRCQLPEYNPKLELSLDTIREMFSKLGLIVNIQPIVTNTVSVSIQYADVRSAIKAKALFEKKDSKFYRPFAGWRLSYGKDPVDRPCPSSLM